MEYIMKHIILVLILFLVNGCAANITNTNNSLVTINTDPGGGIAIVSEHRYPLPHNFNISQIMYKTITVSKSGYKSRSFTYPITNYNGLTYYPSTDNSPSGISITMKRNSES
jgi:hypothetical protein